MPLQHPAGVASGRRLGQLKSRTRLGGLADRSRYSIRRNDAVTNHSDCSDRCNGIVLIIIVVIKVGDRGGGNCSCCRGRIARRVATAATESAVAAVVTRTGNWFKPRDFETG